MKEDNSNGCCVLSASGINPNVPPKSSLPNCIRIFALRPNIKIGLPKLFNKAKQRKNHNVNDVQDAGQSKNKKWFKLGICLPKKAGSTIITIFGDKKPQEKRSPCSNEHQEIQDQNECQDGLNHGSSQGSSLAHKQLLEVCARLFRNQVNSNSRKGVQHKTKKVSRSYGSVNQRDRAKNIFTSYSSIGQRHHGNSDGFASNYGVMSKCETSGNLGRTPSRKFSSHRAVPRARSMRQTSTKLSLEVKQVEDNDGENEDPGHNELCKKRILLGGKCRPLNRSGSLKYDHNGILLPEEIISCDES